MRRLIGCAEMLTCFLGADSMLVENPDVDCHCVPPYGLRCLREQILTLQSYFRFPFCLNSVLLFSSLNSASRQPRLGIFSISMKMHFISSRIVLSSLSNWLAVGLSLPCFVHA